MYNPGDNKGTTLEKTAYCVYLKHVGDALYDAPAAKVNFNDECELLINEKRKIALPVICVIHNGLRQDQIKWFL